MVVFAFASSISGLCVCLSISVSCFYRGESWAYTNIQAKVSIGSIGGWSVACLTRKEVLAMSRD